MKDTLRALKRTKTYVTGNTSWNEDCRSGSNAMQGKPGEGKRLIKNELHVNDIRVAEANETVDTEKHGGRKVYSGASRQKIVLHYPGLLIPPARTVVSRKDHSTLPFRSILTLQLLHWK